MESNSSNPVTDAESSTAAVEELNPDRQLRSPRYWYMLGGILAVFALMPLSNELLPAMASAIVPPVAIVLIYAAAAWKNPLAVGYKPPRGLMWLPYGGGVLLIAVLVGVGSYLHSTLGGWWIPLLSAVVVFLVCALGGPDLDRRWAAYARDWDRSRVG